MFPLVLVCSALIADPPADDLKDYREAAAHAGRDAEAHVRLALWCEAHGLSAERLKHLAIAVLTDPANATARGLMGLVAYRGKWQRPDAVAEQVKADEATAAAMAEYNAKRASAPATGDAHWKLALWCEQKGLKPEMMAHLAAVVRLDPSREAAWSRMGYKKHGRRWMTDAQVAAAKAESEAQKQANHYWQPLLAKWRGWLADKAKRTEAERGLAQVTDPRAVPSVMATFAAGTAAQQEVAVRVLGQIDSQGSSRALAALAVFGGSTGVRRAATETLRRLDPREFAGLLVALLRDPIKYEVRPVGGPGSPGGLFVDGKRFNVQRLYSPPPMPYLPISPADWVDYDANGMPSVVTHVALTYTVNTWSSNKVVERMSLPQFLQSSPTDPNLPPVLQDFRAHWDQERQKFLAHAPHNRGIVTAHPAAANQIWSIAVTQPTGTSTPRMIETRVPVGQIVAEYQMSAVVAQQQLANDVALVDGYNADVKQMNDLVTQILREVSGQDLGDSRTDWEAWWTNLKGYAYFSAPDDPYRPTFVEQVPLAYLPRPVPMMTFDVQTGPTTTVTGPPTASIVSKVASCFGAGTAVRTLSGPRPIETLRVGDQVLTQSTRTGALGYHPILVVHHNPPSPTFLIALAGDTIVSSPFHRFWRVGKGWVMARDLKAGDTLRLLEGPARVESVEAGPVQPVFNLDVADDHDFFAGVAAALVHDNTLPDLREAPFDAAPVRAAVASRAE
jgi:hypothetical protein